MTAKPDSAFVQRNGPGLHVTMMWTNVPIPMSVADWLTVAATTPWDRMSAAVSDR